MVIAYHLIWTAYGNWLPNDPRGSGSRCVAAPQLAELGELHFGRKKIQPPRRVVREFYDRAEPLLQFPVIRFDEAQIDQIACGFTEAIAQHHYTCYACAIMPDHVHLVIRKHRHRAEDMIDNLQSASRLRLSKCGALPNDHPVWTLGGCKRFLGTLDHVRTAIRYVENNPIKIGLPAQSWPFVMPYDNWPFHKRRR
jgi:REP element-mobilizing transposase RayT